MERENEHNQETRFLSVQETCEQFGVGKDAVYALIREGRLKVLRLGRGYRVPLSEIEAFVARELAKQG